MSEKERLVELLLESEPIKERDLDDDWATMKYQTLPNILLKTT